MFEHTRAVKDEIGGVFTVRDEGGVLYIDEVKMTKQKARSDSLHLSTDPGELALWLAEQGAKHGWGSGECVYANWGQWHSHADAAVGRSAEDNATVREYVTHGWYVTIIVNKSGDVDCTVDTLAGGDRLENAIHLTFDGKLEVDYSMTQERKDALAKEREEMYETYTRAVVVHSGSGTNYSDGRTTRLVCSQCKRVPALCQCQNNPKTTNIDTSLTKWPVKGRIPKAIRRDGFSVRFYMAGDVTVTLKKGGQIHWINPGRPSDKEFLRALGITDSLVVEHVQSGNTLHVEPGAEHYRVEENLHRWQGTSYENWWNAQDD